MKKIFKVFGALLAFAMVIGLSSCGDMLNGTQNNGKDDEIGDVLEHTFVLDMGDKDITKQTFIYYTSTTRFSYGEYTQCYYQMSFNVSKKSWILYTRPAASTTPIQEVGKGSYGSKESPIVEGTVTLDGLQAIELKKQSDGKLYFIANIAAVHKAIGAHDEK